MRFADLMELFPYLKLLTLKSLFYLKTITFPECQQKYLEDCLQIISAQLAELEMECDIIIHEKRTIDQESK